MMMMRRGAAVVAVVLCAWVTLAHAGSFDPNRLRFIKAVHVPEYNHYNMLFRGDLPITKNRTFAYDELTTTMRKAAKEAANLTLPSKFYLIDLSLLDPLEFPDQIVEENFFKKNPDLGQYINWLTVGDVVHPDSLGPKLREKMARNLTNWQLDKLPTRMAEIDQFLGVQRDIPHIIYIHCEAGMDRTGEMSGSYYMHALNMTFQHALAIDNSLETRNISIYSQNAFQWYCYFLYYTKDSWRNCKLN
ncbi:hypothetical protein PTSG_00716 [Salpingoeca rosetta]|uniref:Tyrosine specific protein phosphatases domain-containing protein n=1 Tax=Salpingoeca rosetta (strain ATCC 50818 / BSB-021) TaxID=946362 RepID=F2TX99_SALR5|nr:uncharacterized protein PTSG_00716 [Salpingoeca rosetta]EGD76008.1 hypothetical protein PTSG_00716 [Salpingoeca rosetta]|eukprot:XP_004998183.1 hypothetical protein PTSG_00716 [Salpingoeca rosetta]